MSELFDAVRYWAGWNYAFLTEHSVLGGGLVIVVAIILFTAADLLYSRGAASAKDAATRFEQH